MKWRLHALDQLAGVDPAVDREDAADAVEREAEAELDRDREADAHDEHERERVGAEDADGVDADLEDLQLDDAAELDELLRVRRRAVGAHLALEVAAALDRAGLDPQPDRVRPARRDRPREHRGRRLRPVERDADAGAADLQADGVAELGGDDRGDLEPADLAGLVADDAERDLADLDGREVELDRQHELLVAGALAVAEVEPVDRVEADRGRLGRRRGGGAGHDLLEQRVVLQAGLDDGEDPQPEDRLVGAPPLAVALDQVQLLLLGRVDELAALEAEERLERESR